MAAMTHDTIYIEQGGYEPALVGRLFADHYRPLLGSLGIITLLGLWQWFGTSSGDRALFASAPTRVIETARALIASGELATDVAVSGKEFLYGFGLAILTGIPLGILMGWYRYLEALFDPIVNFFYSTPRIAFLPLLIIWLGLGITSKVALVYTGAVFAILINTISGVKNLDQALLLQARSFCASDLQIFKTIALPGSVPFVISGLRLGLGHALIGVVVGELYAATSGVGYLIAVSGNVLQTDKVMVGVIIIAGMGVTCTAVLKRIEDHFQSWRPQQA